MRISKDYFQKKVERRIEKKMEKVKKLREGVSKFVILPHTCCRCKDILFLERVVVQYGAFAPLSNVPGVGSLEYVPGKRTGKGYKTIMCRKCHAAVLLTGEKLSPAPQPQGTVAASGVVFFDPQTYGNYTITYQKSP